MAIRDRRAGLTAAALALAAALPGLAACQSQGRGIETTGSVYPNDYRDRHPIVVQDGPRVLDLFVEGRGGLSSRSERDLANFAAEFRRFGSGPMLVQVPGGPGTNPNTAAAVAQVRAALGGAVAVSGYRPTDPTAASPVRLTFKRLQARVTSQCGLWPDDLGVSDAEQNWKNREYWNLGCAQQANLASQVADPNDLVRGRPEERPDTGRRMYNIQQLRAGSDPSTQWKSQESSVSTAVSQ